MYLLPNLKESNGITVAQSTTSEFVITIENLWAGYGQEPILHDINLSVNKLDYIGIIGPNGGGKTTLFKVLLGLLSPQQGQVKILGRSIQQGRRYIGYVPQVMTFDRSFPINVGDVVRMGRLGKGRLLRHFNRKDDEKVEQALQQVDLLDLKDRPVSELSGGECQRVYIARALATEPQILLLDEPTTSLDRQASTAIYELLRQLNEYVTILMISHDIGMVSSYVKTIGCLNQRLYYHGDSQVTNEMLEQTYGESVEPVIHNRFVPRTLAAHPSKPT